MVRRETIASQRRCHLALLSSLLLLGRAFALSTSTPSWRTHGIHRVSITRTPSALFRAPSSDARGNSGSTTTGKLAATDCSLKSSDELIGSPKRLSLRTLSKISLHVARLRRVFLRVAAILSLLLFGMKSMTAPAHAWGAKESTVLAPVECAAKTSPAAKCVKLIATAGAVAAGATTAKKIGTLNGDGSVDGDGDRTNGVTRIQVKSGEDRAADEVLKILSSPTPTPAAKPTKIDPMPKSSSVVEPLSAEWIQQQLAEAEKEIQGKPAPVSHASEQTVTPAMDSIEEQSALVKDLDSKIEMLRAREELAKADAEQKRLDDIERAAEARRQEKEEIYARIDASAERERVDRAKREERLSEVEHGKKGQERLEELMKKDRRQVDGGIISNANVGPAIDIEEARRQPKSDEEEQILKEKYGNMDLEERAFNILVDLGMVDVHGDPGSSLDWDESDGDAFM